MKYSSFVTLPVKSEVILATPVRGMIKGFGIIPMVTVLNHAKGNGLALIDH